MGWGSWFGGCVLRFDTVRLAPTGLSLRTFDCEGLAMSEPTVRRRRGVGESNGGRQEARTPDLRVANAALSQLS